jgi:hypothetical protein
MLALSRRRLILARSARAAMVGATAAGFTAAAIMAAWVLAGRFPFIGLALALLPAVAATALAVLRRARQALHESLAAAWLILGLAGLASLLAAGAIATARFQYVPNNLIPVLIPLFALAAAAAVAARPPSMQEVARRLDQATHLHDRLATAWELKDRQDDPYLAAVRSQVLSARQSHRLEVRFWRPSGRQIGLLGLALLAAALMLPWEMLQSPQAIQQRLWRQACLPAAHMLEAELDALDASKLAADPQLAGKIAKLAGLAERLRAAKSQDASDWQGRIIEMDELTAALREALAKSTLDEASKRQLERMIASLEQVAADLAETMASPGGPEKVVQPRAGQESVAGKDAPGVGAVVFNPDYQPQSPATAAAGQAPSSSPAPPVIPYDAAWAAAQRKAAQALQRKSIPSEYRQLVKDYFEAK